MAWSEQPGNDPGTAENSSQQMPQQNGYPQQVPQQQMPPQNGYPQQPGVPTGTPYPQAPQTGKRAFKLCLKILAGIALLWLLLNVAIGFVSWLSEGASFGGSTVIIIGSFLDIALFVDILATIVCGIWAIVEGRR